jgi:hypothetical protein
MTIEKVSFLNWNNSLRLANEFLELIVTTDVGPRILSCKFHDRENVLKVYEAQAGGQYESEWQIRGGHRFWLAPEDEALSYHVDNEPVSFQQDESTGEILIDSIQTVPRRIRKTLGILLAENSSRVTVRHVVTNESDETLVASAWALSVMAPGGLQIIPQPPLGEHPRDLQPNRGMVIWPYTDLSDPRLTFGQKFWMLRQSADYPPIKFGLVHRENWVAYLLGETVFLKTFSYEEGVSYPDGGCNFETFSNGEMIEIESLSPVYQLKPGESATHFEDWYLFPLVEEMQIESEDALAEWIEGFLAQTHLK